MFKLERDVKETLIVMTAIIVLMCGAYMLAVGLVDCAAAVGKEIHKQRKCDV